MEPTPLLILGLGNVLCSDDGAGVLAVHQLAARYHRPGVEILDGGTLGLSLLPLLQGARRVLLVDAVLAETPPGSLVRLEGEAVGLAAAQRLSVHQVGVADLLDGARLLGGLPEKVVLCGIVPEHTELGVDLSPRVAAGLAGLVTAVASAAAEMGFPLSSKEGHADAPPVPRSFVDAARLHVQPRG